MYNPCCTPAWNPQCCPPQANPPWWWWYQSCPPPSGGTRPPIAASFAINWAGPINVIVGTAIPTGLWVYVGPTTGAVNVAAAHGSGSITTAAFIFSDGTMTATVAGIIYPVTATVQC
jgi:hypothetical protein